MMEQSMKPRLFMFAMYLEFIKKEKKNKRLFDSVFSITYSSCVV